ncbi:MAG: hypothetical protein Q8P92_01965 [Candidatus Daviesbacteria bacterium]|nr:hypothetical protein [Candidatus Daviesbacteria bacterium]
MFQLILKQIKRHFLFLILVIPLTFYTFNPIVDLRLGEWDYFELEYQLRVIRSSNPILFYLTSQYGTAYAMIGIASYIFGPNENAYFFLNVGLRFLASVSIYLLISWWSKVKVTGIIAALFFLSSAPGLENTLWVIHFHAYASIILFCVSLYFWRSFHNNPSGNLLKESLFCFFAALYISHLRIYALPLIIFAGELYFFVIDIGQTTAKKLKILHFLLLLIIIFIYFVITSTKVTTEVLRLVSPQVLLSSLVNGYPPIIHSFILLNSNTILYYSNIGALINLPLTNIQTALSLLIPIISIPTFIFALIFLTRKKFLIGFAFLPALIYPLTLLLIYSTLNWQNTAVITTLIGGTFLLYLIPLNLIILKINKGYWELFMLGVLILTTHLLLPWAIFPQDENNIQSAFYAVSRYYTVPSMGVGLILGVIFLLSYRSIKKIRYLVLYRSLSFKNIFIPLFIAVPIFIFIPVLINYHLINTRQIIISRVEADDKKSVDYLWKVTKPFFEQVKNKKEEKLVYYEGELTDKEKYVTENILRHKLTQIGFYNPVQINNVIFLNDKDKLRSILLEKNKIFNWDYIFEDFFAIQYTKNDAFDIKQKILEELNL